MRIIRPRRKEFLGCTPYLAFPTMVLVYCVSVRYWATEGRACSLGAARSISKVDQNGGGFDIRNGSCTVVDLISEWILYIL